MPGRAISPRVTLEDRAAALIDDVGKRLRRISRGRADSEDVHRLRSGCRRLEALLTDLLGVSGSAGRSASRLYAHVRKLRKAAGAVRDADVSMELVRAMASADGWDPPLQRVVQSTLARERRLALVTLEQTADRRRYRRLGHRLSALTKSSRVPAARMLAAISRRLRRAQRLALRLDADPESLHRTRIAIKRIRDLSELASPALGPSIPSLAAQAERLSDRLGRAQDLRVLAQVIERVEEGVGSAIPGLEPTKRRLDARYRLARAGSLRAIAEINTLNVAPHAIAS